MARPIPTPRHRTGSTEASRCAGLAAHVEDAATALDDEAQQALDTVVVVTVRANPVVAVFGDIVLLLLSPIAKLVEGLRPPILCLWSESSSRRVTPRDLFPNDGGPPLVFRNQRSQRAV